MIGESGDSLKGPIAEEDEWCLGLAREISRGRSSLEIEAITQYMRNNPGWGIRYYEVDGNPGELMGIK